MSKRICLLGSAHSVYNIRWANRLAELGWEVHLVTWRRANPSHALNPAVSVSRIVAPPHSLALPVALLEVSQLIRRKNPDIVHGHYVHTFGTLAGLNAVTRKDYPTVISAWGPGGMLEMSGPLRRIAVLAMKHADVVTTTSRYMAQILSEHYSLPDQKIVTFPWGIDTTIFRCVHEGDASALATGLGIPSDATVFLSPRNATPYYRIEHIVRAAGAVCTKRERVYFVILAGALPDVAYLRRLRRLAADLRIAERIVFVERELTAHEMAALYNLAIATVNVPRNDLIGSCILESMACGCVPVVARLEAYGLYLKDGHNGLVVDGDSSDDIARACERALDDGSLQERCRTLNRQLIETYESWDENSKRMEQLYCELIASREEHRR